MKAKPVIFRILSFILFISCATGLFAQSSNIVVGVVVDETGEPLPGASIVVMKGKDMARTILMYMSSDERWQKNFFNESSVHTVGVRYHSKAGFMRIGNEDKFPLTAEIALHMVTQFGGTCYNSENRPGNSHHNQSRLKDYFYALIPLGGDDSYDASDQANVAGNMLGSWMGTITWNDESWKVRGYYEHTFEHN